MVAEEARRPEPVRVVELAGAGPRSSEVAVPGALRDAAVQVPEM